MQQGQIVGDFSTTLTTTPVQIFPDPVRIGPNPIGYQCIFNCSSTVDIWISRSNPNVSVGGVGCKRIAPLTQEEFGVSGGGRAPPMPVWAVAASGTVAIDAERYAPS